MVGRITPDKAEVDLTQLKGPSPLLGIRKWSRWMLRNRAQEYQIGEVMNQLAANCRATFLKISAKDENEK
jgi:hypothetical protein